MGKHYVKNRLFKEQDGKCYFCKKSILFELMTIDHIVPRIKGGESYLENYVLVCKPCNHKKSGMWAHEFIKKMNFK